MKRCPTPDKGKYRSKVAALFAIANGAKGNTAYPCHSGCGFWHTTTQVRTKPRRRR